MKIEGTGEVQPQVDSEVVEAQETTEPQGEVEQSQDEVVLPSDEQTFEMPEKFNGKSAEDIAKAYLELEKMNSKRQEEKQEVVDEAEKAEPEVDEEYETWKQEKKFKETLDPVGGLEKYNEALAWAKDNLSAEEIESYNNSIKNNTDVDTIRLLAKSLIQQAEVSNNPPREPQPLHASETAKTPKVSGYETKSDMMKDMRDPRYEKDEGFRQKVAAKLAKTNESSWY